MRAFVFSLLLIAGCSKTPPADSRPSSDTPCPKDELAAIGRACAPEGKTCGTNPSGFTHFIMCSRGKWIEMEAAPPPPPVT